MKSVYKYDLALFILLPIITAMLGGTIIYGGFSSFVGFGNVDNLREIGVFQIYLGCSLLAGLVAMIYRIAKTSHYWYATLALSLLYTVYIHREIVQHFSIVKLYLPILGFAVALTLIVTRIFFCKSLIKFRSVLFGVSGAITLALFMRVLYFLLGLPIEPGFLFTRMANSLYLFLFIGFGMAMADLAVTKAELKRAQAEFSEYDEEDDDDDPEIESEDEDEPTRRPRLPRRSR